MIAIRRGDRDSALRQEQRVIPRRSQNGFLLAAAMNSGGASQKHRRRVSRGALWSARTCPRFEAGGDLSPWTGCLRVCGVVSRRADKSAPPQSGVKPPQSKARRAKGSASGAGSLAARRGISQLTLSVICGIPRRARNDMRCFRATAAKRGGGAMASGCLRQNRTSTGFRQFVSEVFRQTP